jgi:DnaK suppressor protein
MTSRELLQFKKVLENKQDAALRAALQRRQSILVEQSADAYEQITYADERELALADLSRHSDQIRQIQAALERIAAGTFGVCRRCGKPIRSKRLMAVPWTPLCIRCQETADGQDKAGLHPGDEIRESAA